MVRKTSGREASEQVLAHLLDLWRSGVAVEASVVLHADGRGRFAIDIVEGGESGESGESMEPKTLPETPSAKRAR